MNDIQINQTGFIICFKATKETKVQPTPTPAKTKESLNNLYHSKQHQSKTQGAG